MKKQKRKSNRKESRLMKIAKIQEKQQKQFAKPAKSKVVAPPKRDSAVTELSYAERYKELLEARAKLRAECRALRYPKEGKVYVMPLLLLPPITDNRVHAGFFPMIYNDSKRPGEFRPAFSNIEHYAIFFNGFKHVYPTPRLAMEMWHKGKPLQTDPLVHEFPDSGEMK